MRGEGRGHVINAGDSGDFGDVQGGPSWHRGGMREGPALRDTELADMQRSPTLPDISVGVGFPR